jgi:hypothetical protein
LAEEAAAGLGLVAAPEAVEVALEAPAAGQGSAAEQVVVAEMQHPESG